MSLRSAGSFVIAIVGCSPSPPPAPATPVVATANADAPKPATTAEPAEPESPVSPDDEPLPAYVPGPDPTYVPPPPGAATAAANDPAPDPSDVKACTARGGKIQAVCMMGAFECIVRHRDAGKRCTDGRECSSGKCVHEGRQATGSRAAGVCQRDNNPCGCRALVVGGQVQPTMCTD